MALSKIDVANMLTGLVPNDNTIRRPLSKPIIINGDMAVAQRSTSVTGVSNGDGGYQTCDRMRFDESGTMGAALTITQESLTSGNAFLNGFANAFKVDVTTADSSPDADDWSRLNMRIEAQDMKPFKKGTSNAEKYTLAFWVKATKTGTNTIELFDADNTRSIGGSYTISSSNTWEHKVVNFAADTTGAFADDNGEGLRISWSLSAGSNYTSGTLPSAWESSTVANTAPNQVNHFDSTSNNFHITGIQLEVGEFSSTTLPPFQFESFGDNLARCQRYFYNHVDRRVSVGQSDDNMIIGKGGFNSSAQFEATVHFPVTMRTAPTLELGSGSNFFKLFVSNTSHQFDDFAVHADQNNATSLFKGSFSGTQGDAGNLVVNNANAFVHFGCEL
jgi:hypothetical protein